MKAAPVLAAPLGDGECVLPGYTVAEHPSRLHARGVQSAPAPFKGSRLLRFSHPHIVRAHELITGDRPAVMLETLSLGTLAHLIAHNPRGLRLADVVILDVHLSSAVQYMHAEGLLHMDVKPSNIVSDRRMAKLLDLDSAQPAGWGFGQGTPQYMAPEQMRREVLGPAADVWGIGSVLFEAATGRLPFESPTGNRTSHFEQGATAIRANRRRWPRSPCEAVRQPCTLILGSDPQ